MLREVPGYFANHTLLADGDKFVEMRVDGTEIAYRLNDRVKVTPDCIGYICPGVTRGGFGTIVEIRNGEFCTDYYFGVQMDNGQFGYMKYSRFAKLEDDLREIATMFSGIVLIAKGDRIIEVHTELGNGESYSFHLNERVKVTPDCMGYICPGVTRPGFGTITELREDDSDYFFGVTLDDGQFGFMKEARIEKA